MAQANDHDIRVLNGLYESARETAQGYRDAAGEGEDVDRRAMFSNRAEKREALAETLAQEVRARGGEPEGEPSLLTKARQALSDIGQALKPDDAGVVGAVEAGEDRIKARFEKALADNGLSATTRETVRRAWAEVKADHDEMSALKHSLDSRRTADSPIFPS